MNDKEPEIEIGSSVTGKLIIQLHSESGQIVRAWANLDTAKKIRELINENVNRIEREETMRQLALTPCQPIMP